MVHKLKQVKVHENINLGIWAQLAAGLVLPFQCYSITSVPNKSMSRRRFLIVHRGDLSGHSFHAARGVITVVPAFAIISTGIKQQFYIYTHSKPVSTLYSELKAFIKIPSCQEMKSRASKNLKYSITAWGRGWAAFLNSNGGTNAVDRENGSPYHRLSSLMTRWPESSGCGLKGLVTCWWRQKWVCHSPTKPFHYLWTSQFTDCADFDWVSPWLQFVKGAPPTARCAPLGRAVAGGQLPDYFPFKCFFHNNHVLCFLCVAAG